MGDHEPRIRAAAPGAHGMVGAALRRALLHMRRRHFALGAAHRARQKVAKAVMAGAHANKFQLAVTLLGPLVPLDRDPSV